MLIDWQGCGFDLVSNDLMWCLYGFIKNLPETGEMIHGFVEYSLVTYWDFLKSVLKSFGDTCSDFDIPEDSDWAAELIKEGFTLEFMKNAIIRPVLCLKNTQLLMDWFHKITSGSPDEPPPPESEIFKSETYSNFIYLYMKIGTEVNVFSHLGKVLFMYMKEAMFSDDDPDKEDESEEEEEKEEKNDQTCAMVDSTQENGTENSGEAEPRTTDLDNPGENENVRSISELRNGSEQSTGEEELVQDCKETLNKISTLAPELFPQSKPAEPEMTTVTSMYGKVYKVRKS
ncbi:uncharacterized protein LOC111713657 isoform X2 [Eurytemora carolleeae]|uniref:uncharacterized protein LOC111713657 isoform X2 n=1 Tax=Eurytemora carolleeae TaxID=1294199 RepID=UPI000C755DC0|nr:uncharacterized protein LOC111713657 isoform X2 [Eurytemora carolleeae]|eukprot:XP_023344350.1 uncharacterized protein LOC111713657 isoform X2 [Eurytemora affinis]